MEYDDLERLKDEPPAATRVAEIVSFLDALAPPALAAEWDNVGLLLGDRRREARRVVVCLTLTPPVVEEAVAERADLVVVHHPLPFRPLKSITTDTFDGDRVWRMASAGISIYSPHTAFDSAAAGINQTLAESFGLVDVRPLAPTEEDSPIGAGRFGKLPQPLATAEFAARIKALLKIDFVQTAGARDSVQTIGVACGSAGEFLRPALKLGCDCFVTGEASFHTAVEAEAAGAQLMLTGHYAGERFGVERLATMLQAAFEGVQVWAARRESDSLRWM